MAKPIKETPILTGKDAKKFLQENSLPKNSAEIQREKERILKNYKLFQSAETFGKSIKS